MLKKIILTTITVVTMTITVGASENINKTKEEVKIKTIGEKNCDFVKNMNDMSELTDKNKGCVLKFLSEQISQQLPMQVDKFTELTNVIAMGDNLLTYRYRISNFPDNVDMKLVRLSMQTLLLNNNCTTPDIRKMIDKNITISHSYYDAKSKYLFDVEITEEKCKNINKYEEKEKSYIKALKKKIREQNQTAKKEKK